MPPRTKKLAPEDLDEANVRVRREAGVRNSDPDSMVQGLKTELGNLELKAKNADDAEKEGLLDRAKQVKVEIGRYTELGKTGGRIFEGAFEQR